MPTKEEACRAAARVASEGYRVLFLYPLDEAARRCLRPGGPSFEEMRERIAHKREQRMRPASPASDSEGR